MDLEMISLYTWIALTNALSAGIVGLIMYRLGKKNGLNMYKMAKKELKNDVSKFLQAQFNGITGPMAKKAKEKANRIFNEAVEKNPQAAQMAMGVTLDAIGAAAGESLFGLEGARAKNFGKGLKYFMGKKAQGVQAPQIGAGPPRKEHAPNRIP